MRRTIFAWIAAFIASTTLANAEEPDRGAMLYENLCMECHESIVHVRAQTKVKTLAELDTEIRRWSDHKQLGWGDEERNAVLDYLNLSFYGFFEDFSEPPKSPEAGSQ